MHRLTVFDEKTWFVERCLCFDPVFVPASLKLQLDRRHVFQFIWGVGMQTFRYF